MKKITIGSNIFFKDYVDYTSHDVDYIVFEDNPKQYKNFMHINLKCKGSDTFYYRDMSKEEFIEYELKHCSNVPMAVGKFLVPELCHYKGITLEDLKLFEKAFDNLDDKHKYEKLIYNAYIKNGDFVLTNEQRNEAYKVYKEARK